MNTELYNCLRIRPDATPEQIKTAHRVMVKKHHPDAGGNPDTFRQIQQAYDVLSDPEARRRYDDTGIMDTRDPVDRIQEQAFALFASLISKPVQELDEHICEVDFLKRMKVEVINRRVEATDQLDEFTKRLTLAERLRTKFKANDGANNHADDVLRGTIGQIEQGRDKYKEQLQVLDRVDAMLADLIYEKDEPKPMAGGNYDAVQRMAQSAGVNQGGFFKWGGA